MNPRQGTGYLGLLENPHLIFPMYRYYLVQILKIYAHDTHPPKNPIENREVCLS